MRKLIVTEFLSLDGVMQAPGAPDEDRSGGFAHGGWQRQYFDDVFARVASEGMPETGGFLFGRRTYQIMASFWPSQPDDDMFAAVLNSLPKYVASTTLSEPLEWRNSSLLRGDVAKAVTELKEQPGKNLVVLGSGKRLFRDGSARRPLKLVRSMTSSTGVLIATYEPERS